MEDSLFKKVIYCLLLSTLLLGASCATMTTSKPTSELTQEEIEQQDPLYWFFWGTVKSGLGK